MPVNDRREIFGWAMYDWANSGFQVTVLTVMSGPYLTALAQRDVGENGLIFDLGPFLVTAKSFFPFCIGLSVFLQVFLLPVLGAIADYTNLKKKLMAFFCYAGSAATSLFLFITGNRYLAGGLILIVASLCFGASLVLYNARGQALGFRLWTLGCEPRQPLPAGNEHRLDELSRSVPFWTGDLARFRVRCDYGES
jgi:MFS transporter, UMF1 family